MVISVADRGLFQLPAGEPAGLVVDLRGVRAAAESVPAFTAVPDAWSRYACKRHTIDPFLRPRLTASGATDGAQEWRLAGLRVERPAPPETLTDQRMI